MSSSDFPYKGDGICHRCGITWGAPPIGAHGRWSGKCSICGIDVCIHDGGLADIRDYGYLRKWYERNPLIIYWHNEDGTTDEEELPTRCPSCGQDLTIRGVMLFYLKLIVTGERQIDWEGGSYRDLLDEESADTLAGASAYDLAQEGSLDKVECGNCNTTIYTGRELNF